MKKIAFAFFLIAFSGVLALNGLALPYQAYQYVNGNNGIYDVASQVPYVPQAVLGSRELGVTLSSPEDFCRDPGGNFYVVDSKQNAVYEFDRNWKLLHTIRQFDDLSGKPSGFNSPDGVFVTPAGDIYVADTLNGRIVVFNKQYKAIKIIQNSQSVILGSDFVFQPQKVAVDSAQRIFVIVKNVYEGLMQFTENGSFTGYIGSNRVVASPIDRLWHMIMTKQQKQSLISFVPVEYSNICLDSGFIYAVTSVRDVDNPIRRLNLSGDDILIRNPINGQGKVTGDLLYVDDVTNTALGPSSFVDITADTNGVYYALDSRKGRIFAYDDQGNMLYVFGALGSAQKGTFFEPRAIEWADGNLYVIDRRRAQITVFAPTAYTSYIPSTIIRI